MGDIKLSENVGFKSPLGVGEQGFQQPEVKNTCLYKQTQSRNWKIKELHLDILKPTLTNSMQFFCNFPFFLNYRKFARFFSNNYQINNGNLILKMYMYFYALSGLMTISSKPEVVKIIIFWSVFFCWTVWYVTTWFSEVPTYDSR